MSRTVNKYHFQCTDCDTIYQQDEVKYLCPVCSAENTNISPPKGVLKTIYEYENLIDKHTDFKTLKENNFLDLLPIRDFKNMPNLKIGKTPLYKIDKIQKSKLVFQLFLKDDSQNPTFSFKDRASALVSAFAKEHSYNTIIAASTGNAGSSLAGICAAQGQKAIILVPESAPKAKLAQILMYGAAIVPVRGNYDDAFDLSIKATEEFGWYNRNTAFNPFTIEGKKTVSFELFEQLNFKVPDRIFVPVGDGVIISGVYKGFEDLLRLKIIDKMPVIVAVQAKNSDNLVRNINNASFEIIESNTLADSISVDIPRNFYMAQKFIKKYNGETITIEDKNILKASSLLAKNTGLFAEPAAATAFAGFLSYFENKKIENKSKNIVLLTGSGLKDIAAVKDLINMPKAILPDIAELKNMVK
jgi:threonine synthase